MPCHAVVIENLRNYRPDELQTRRENRALMTWSSGKVRKYLEEACQLYGLHLHEVMPNYTSRQDSRTGMPGVRCVEVPVDTTKGEPKAYWWKKALNAAKKKTGDRDTAEKKGDAKSQFIVALAAHLAHLKATGESLPKSVRVPRNGGDLFVAAQPPSCQANGHRPCPLCYGKRGLQADLNAAANIGLRALLDPDFSGKWWYVACDPKTGRPVADKVKGGILETVGALFVPANAESAETTKGGRGKKMVAKPKEVVNQWRDPQASVIRGIDGGEDWQETHAYWNHVQCRVIGFLWQQAGIERA